MTEKEIKDGLQKYIEASKIEDQITNRMYEIIQLICKTFKITLDWWDWDYTDSEYEARMPTDDILNKEYLSPYVCCSSSKYSDFLCDIPTKYLWMDDADILKELKKEKQEYDNQLKLTQQKTKEKTAKQKLLKSKLKEKEIELKKELGL